MAIMASKPSCLGPQRTAGMAPYPQRRGHRGHGEECDPELRWVVDADGRIEPPRKNLAIFSHVGPKVNPNDLRSVAAIAEERAERSLGRSQNREEPSRGEG